MSVRILVGDVRAQLATLADESVHCVVTSPPYWGLRDYGVDGQIGLESSPWEFIDTMVQVFREVRRVLRADGTLWCNLGDSYAGGRRGGNPTAASSTLEGGLASQEASMRTASRRRDDEPIPRSDVRINGLKPKDLVGIPWRVALALQADGWWLRQDIIWSKPNPMPESVRDRCTKAHEYLFLLTKSERYYFDAKAIAEPTSWDPSNTKMPDGWDTGEGGHGSFHRGGREKGRRAHVPGNKSHKGTTAYLDGHEEHRTKAGLVAFAERERSKRDSFKRDCKESAIPGQAALQHRDGRDESEWDTATRNKRSVWTVATAPFKEAHFATFPPALIEPCILAGCPVGGVVLDPFGGAGTTALVADRHGRDAILIELNPEYAAMAERRIRGDSPLFAEVQ